MRVQPNTLCCSLLLSAQHQPCEVGEFPAVEMLTRAEMVVLDITIVCALYVACQQAVDTC